MIRVKRIYEPSEDSDGFRVLVDRLWPRGLKRERAKIDLWLRELGPSNELRRWFQHDPEKWQEFKRRYTAELESRKSLMDQLHERARKQTVTLLYGSREETYNNAHALKEYLEAA